jgi:hypothetical protein
MERDNGMLRVTIREAANRLGVTEAAIRKRIQRGSLSKEMGSDGRVYVYLGLSEDRSHPESQVHHEALVEDLREQILYLREILNEERDARRRADTIIARLTQANAALAQRVPELEAPREPPGGPETASGHRGNVPSATGDAQEKSSENRPRDTAEFPVRGRLVRPWWRRMFGG